MCEDKIMGDYKISVVVPVFEEGNQIFKNICIIHNVLIENSIKHEFILVDDGSLDNTWGELEKLAKEIPFTQAIRLSRNFGKEAAICAGLRSASGDACVVMDSDLQHPPEVIPEMIKLWYDKGYNIVEGVKVSRGHEKAVNRYSAHVFYKIMRTLTGYNLKNATDFKLIDLKVLSAWKAMNESNTFFRGMVSWLGYKTTTIPFEVADRSSGKTKWSIVKLFKLATNAITSFSSIPLQIVTMFGLLLLILDIPIAINALSSKIKGETIDGVTTIIFLLIIIGSSIMISLGVMGTYIARIFDEVKNRPRYVVSDRINNTNKEKFKLHLKKSMNMQDKECE